MDIIYIPIGDACTVAAALRTLGKRDTAYPFDWLIAPIQNITRCVREDFAGFLQGCKRADAHTVQSCVIDSYGFQFRHDFPTIKTNSTDNTDTIDDGGYHEETTIVDNWRDFIPDIQAKYSRRIERLRSVLNNKDHQNKVVFVRRGTTSKVHVVEFIGVIEEKYPTLEFTVLIVNGSELSYQHPKIKTGFVSDNPVWNNPDDWASIL